MSSFYYLNGKDQRGPFTHEQLIEEDINLETLVWSKEMDNWSKIKDLSDNYSYIKNKVTPPKFNEDNDEIELTIDESFENKNLSEEKETTVKEDKSSKWLLMWISFHFLALVLATTGIRIFNQWGKAETKEFWPFVEIFQTYNLQTDYNYMTKDYNLERTTSFRGLFFNYDWSEFTVYVGIGLMWFAFRKMSKK